MPFSARQGLFARAPLVQGFPNFPTNPTSEQYTTLLSKFNQASAPTITELQHGLGTVFLRGSTAHPNGKIYVVDLTNGRMIEFDPVAETFTVKASYTGAASFTITTGVVGENGIIYYPPGGTTYTNRMHYYDPVLNVFSFVSVPNGWTGTKSYASSCRLPNGDIFLLPDANGGYAHRWTPGSDTVTAITGITGVANAFIACQVAPNGKVYMIPFFDTNRRVLKYDPDTGTVTEIGTAPETTNPLYGGSCLGKDGKIYCPPHTATNVLIVDPFTDTVSSNDYGLSLTGGNKFFGMTLGKDGRLYCPPFDTTTDTALIINTDAQTATRDTVYSITGNYALGAVTGVGEKSWGLDTVNQTSVMKIATNSTAEITDAEKSQFLYSPAGGSQGR